MESKPFWRSTTFLLNAAFLVGAVAAWLVGHPGVLAALGVSPTMQAAILAIANVLLRFKTTRPITLAGDAH